MPDVSRDHRGPVHVSLVMYTDMYTSMTRAMYAIAAGICRLRSRSLIAH